MNRVNNEVKYLQFENFSERAIEIFFKNKVRKNSIIYKFLKLIIAFLSKKNQLELIYRGRTEPDYLKFMSDFYQSINFRCTFYKESARNIPTSGPVIFVANHSLGFAENAFFIEIQKIRPDTKFMVNSIVVSIDESIKEGAIEVPEFDFNKTFATRQMIKHLKNNGAVLIFPAGKVSTHLSNGKTYDGFWSDSFCRVSEKTAADIVPIHVNGCLSNRYYRLSKMGGIFWMFAQLTLLAEMFKLKGKALDIVVGHPIRAEHMRQLNIDTDSKAAAIRHEVYLLDINKDK